MSGLNNELIQLKMNEDNQNTELVTDLGLAPGYSGQSTRRKLNNDTGAGANAGSRVDMKFVASDPLSELVWSPQNGLSLKCADCSFADKKPSLLWIAGPSNTVLSPSQNITAGRSSTDKPVNRENFLTSQGAFHVRSEMAGRDTSARTPGSDATVMPVYGLSQEDRTDEIRLDLVRNEMSSRDPTGGSRDDGCGNQISRMEIALDSQVHPTKECEANDTLAQILTSPGRGNEGSASFLEKESRRNITMTIGVNPLEKVESISENDVRNLISRNVCAAVNKIVASESALEIKQSLQQDEEILPTDKIVSGEHSPIKSRILRRQRKGKEKALSDGDLNERMSKEDDDSHESVESCNSAGLFSTGKKRWSFEQQLIVGSKRVKKHTQESPGSATCVKQDSSFMNWISNMMNGLKSNQDEAPSLALTLAHPYHGQESPDQKLITCNKNQDARCKNMGFQSIFQSLYCPKTKVQETLDDDYQTELDLGNRYCDISTATPIACHGDNDNLCKQFLISNEKFNESTSGNGADPATQPKISSANFASSQENSKVKSTENKNSCNLTAGKVKGGTDSSCSIGKHKTSSAEKINCEPPSDLKAPYNFSHGCDPLGSLWITRFTTKTSFPLLNLQNSGEALECSTNCVVSYSNDLKIMEAGPRATKDPPIPVAKESENCAADKEASIGVNRIKGSNDQKSICKLNPVFPSLRFKNSEAMASVFARRLDALKHIMPSGGTDNAACAAITCFFCGRKGHHLRDCSEIADGELEYLIRNINSYKGSEELPCLCIRCFELNHWAVACPNASSRVQNQSNCGASLCNDWSPPSEMHLNKRNEESRKLFGGNKNPFQASGADTVCDQNDPRIEAGLNINCNMTKVSTPDKPIRSTSLVKDYIPASTRENNLKENQIMPFCNFVDKQVSEVPKGIFDAVKRLRLSRADILKWMNSHMSLAYLNGYFLRLRLGKWEEGLGGSGYYVACVTGAQKESSAQDSKTSISVDVGGVKCLVESQYVSNHDFLEDELMAWWSATTKSGNKLPSEGDMRLKLEERKMLGL